MGIKCKIPEFTRELMEMYSSELRNGDRYFTPCTLNELVNRLISIKNKEHTSDSRINFYTKKVIKQYLELISTKNSVMRTNLDISRMPPNKTNKWDLPRSMQRRITFYEINKELGTFALHHFEHNLLDINCEFIDHLLELCIVYYSEPALSYSSDEE